MIVASWQGCVYGVQKGHPTDLTLAVLVVTLGERAVLETARARCQILSCGCFQHLYVHIGQCHSGTAQFSLAAGYLCSCSVPLVL